MRFKYLWKEKWYFIDFEKDNLGFEFMVYEKRAKTSKLILCEIEELKKKLKDENKGIKDSASSFWIGYRKGNQKALEKIKELFG